MAHPNTRPARTDEERQERRRRKAGTLDRMAELTMTVPDEVRAKNPDRDFRWINDTGRRMHAKTVLDDWDRVDGVDPLTVGTDREGKPMKAYLCSKPKSFTAEDMAGKMAALREQERGLIKGERDGTGKSDLPEDRAYVPDGGKNSINRLNA